LGPDAILDIAGELGGHVHTPVVEVSGYAIVIKMAPMRMKDVACPALMANFMAGNVTAAPERQDIAALVMIISQVIFHI
jgi:hypothetical protein